MQNILILISYISKHQMSSKYRVLMFACWMKKQLYVLNGDSFVVFTNYLIEVKFDGEVWQKYFLCMAHSHRCQVSIDGRGKKKRREKWMVLGEIVVCEGQHLYKYQSHVYWEYGIHTAYMFKGRSWTFLPDISCFRSNQIFPKDL